MLPAWFGLALGFGTADASTGRERLVAFAISVTTLIAAAVATYALLRLRHKRAQRLASERLRKPADVEP